jgi:hypothetical protein
MPPEYYSGGCVRLFILMILSVLASFTIWITLRQRRDLEYLRDLCDLRGNALTYHRMRLDRPYSGAVFSKADLDKLSLHFKRFVQRYQKLTQIHKDQELELQRSQRVNTDLVEQLGESLDENRALQTQLNSLRRESAELEAFAIDYAEIQAENKALRITNARLLQRNQDLEYAINLESISMIEKYESDGKLLSVINDIRRSLSRVLNPA